MLSFSVNGVHFGLHNAAISDVVISKVLQEDLSVSGGITGSFADVSTGRDNGELFFRKVERRQITDRPADSNSETRIHYHRE